MKQIISLITVSVIFFLASCKSKHEQHAETSSDYYYTCPMHLSVESKTPGSCPVCNMTLIKATALEKKQEGQESNSVTIEEPRQTLASIETDTVKFRNISSASTILGTVAIDEENVKGISSRVKGRIEKLFVKTSGIYVQKGTPLYTIYSEQLVADEKEYLTLLQKRSSAKILDYMFVASKNKLLLWGLTENQISDLEKTGIANPLVTFNSSIEGYVIEVKIIEGIYVEEGTPLFEITTLNSVWIEAQVYSNEIAKAKLSNIVSIYSETTPEKIYTGHIVFNNPLMEKGRKIQLLRIRVDNSDNKLIPGMMVIVNPELETKKVLAVPKSAVLLEKMKTVWIKTSKNTFEQRMINTGIENKEFVEVLSGINEGEIIVTSGAYLISSEFILKNGATKRHNH